MKPLQQKILAALVREPATRKALRQQCGCTLQGILSAEAALLDAGLIEHWPPYTGTLQLRITDAGLREVAS